MYDKLPTVRYLTPNGVQELSDITTTFKISQQVVDEGAYPIDAYVPDTDRPDVFSNRIYGDPSQYWTLLNLNDMVNPFYDWVLSPQAFENYMDEKYPGYTLFLLHVGGTLPFEGSFRTNDIVYTTGVSSAALQPSVQSSLENARVVSYDPTYCRLVIDLTQKTAWIPAEGTLIAGANVNSTGVTQYYVGMIGKVSETQYAAHHFETNLREVLNPRVPASFHKKLITENDFGFTFGSTPLGRYILEDFTGYTITNREHEIRTNDNRRNIVVVSKPYLANVNRDVERLLNNEE